ncbi:hypothetical protein AURDEDRAFT_117057 [Auricularia subglabra TFB-10046 SS5]|nr:hypothetical protein AURDEDRAFT_117057 [Auricularia subglabra TFB-10046 SS5]
MPSLHKPFPSRRTSAHNVSPASTSNGKAHKATESTSQLSVTDSASAPNASSSFTAPTANANWQDKLMNSFFKRIKDKLPCYSGMTLHELESDEAMATTVDALVYMTRSRMGQISWLLLELLEKLSKQTHDPTEKWRKDVLQSQLYIIKVLSKALSVQWDLEREGKGLPKQTLHPSEIAHQEQSEWVDPPAIQDETAAYIISVMTLYVRQTRHSVDRPPEFLHMTNDTSFHSFETLEPVSPVTGEIMAIDDLMAAYDNRTKRVHTDADSETSMGASRINIEPTPPTLSSSDNSLNRLILKYVGRIIFHVSASNWKTVFTRISKGIRTLASTTEDGADTTDMWLMAHSALDRVRLVTILQELSSLLVNMRPDAQSGVSQALRQGMWGWINVFPYEYIDASINPRKLEGAAERVYDAMQQLVDAERRHAFWPTMTLLLSTSPERLKQLETAFAMGIGGSSTTKSKTKAKPGRLAAWSEIHKTLGSASKTAELSMACYVKLCKLATIVPASLDAPIRSIAPDLAQELHTRLMTPPPPLRPYYDTVEHLLDVGLYSDVLVSIYRLDPQTAIQQVFLPSLHALRSDTVKTVVVKACLTLTIDARRYPHQPSIEPAYGCAVRIRQIFMASCKRQHEMSRETGLPIRASNRPNGKKYYMDDSTSERDLLMLAINALWRTDVKFLFHEMSEDSWGHGVVGTEFQRNLNAPEVNLSISRTAAAVFLLTGIVPSDSPLSAIAQIWHQNSMQELLVAMSTHLLMQPHDATAQRLLMPNINLVLCGYADEDIPENEDEPWKYSTDRLPGFLAAEFALLITMFSPGTDISLRAARALQLLARAERHERAPRPEFLAPEEQAKRWAVYEQVGAERYHLIGRAAYQKRLRHILRVLSPPSSMNLALFQYCYGRWAELSTRATHAADVDPATRAAWQNLTFALVGIAGCCVPAEGENTDIRSLARYMPQHLESVAAIPQQPLGAAKKFIMDLMDMLDDENVMIRETAKDALGIEMHSRLFPTLLQQMDYAIARGYDMERPEEGVPLLFEQSMSVLRLMLDRIDAPPEMSKLNVDISRMLLVLARFVHRSDVSRAGYRVKMKFCHLCDALIAKRHYLTIRKEGTLRNALVEKLFEWVKDSQSLRTIDPSHTRLQAESDTACLATAVRLLDKMRLEPPENATSSDTANLLSRLFYRYLADMEAMAGVRNTGSIKSDDDLAESFTSSMRTGRDEPLIRELVVNGVVNMLQANPDAGTKHCLQLGFADDIRLRILFCQVFSRALASGRKLETNAAPPAPPQRNQLCEMLRESDMLALAVCEICPANEVEIVIPVLLNVFDTRDSLLRLMKAAIDREIARTESDKELFRSNTVCTRLLGAFAKMQGYNYLRKIIEPIVNQLKAMPADQSFEIDPMKTQNETDTEQNMANLKLIAQALLDVICDSAPSMPSIMMDVCKHIADAVGEVWPASRQTALGAFLFLRFICPAIVSPETVDIDIPKENTQIRRGLLLMTKIIQNLANNVLFGKELFLVALNSFLNDNVRKVQAFQESVVKGAVEGEPTIGNRDLGAFFDETDAIVLQRFFQLHADKVGKELLSYASNDAANINGKRTWDLLCAALVELGQPIERPQLIPLDSMRHPKFIDFMNRNTHRVLDTVRSIFFETPSNPDRNLVFVLALSKVNVETDDLELVLLQIFRTLVESNARNQPFEIIIDCTAFLSASEIPLPWIKYIIELIPSDLALQFQTAYIVNSNGAAQGYFRKVLHALANVPFGKHIMAVSSLQDLADILPASSLAAMTSCASLDRELKETFTDVTQVLRGAARIPVTFQLGTTHIRVTSTKATQIFPGIQCKTTEIIPYSDVGDVTQYAGEKAPEFTIRRQRQGGTLIFASPSKDVIIKAIRSAKTRQKSQETMSIDRSSRNVVLSATLTNVGLLHLCHEDEGLRSAAHDLLCSLCTYLDYDGASILPSRGGFVPANAAAVSIPFSETLARFAPQLTLDFLFEFCIAFDKLTTGQKAVSMQFVAPWLRNLNMFVNPRDSLFESAGSKLRDCLRFLIDLTVKDQEIYPLAQRHVWSEIGRLDAALIGIALDELIRAAVDGGIGSMRCELVADTLVSLSSVSVRGKIITRLRRAFAKTSATQTRNLVDNPAWGEIAALTRLALVVSYNTRHPIQTQLFVPETAHLATILASVGTVVMRTSVHGLVLNLIQSLYASRQEHAASAEALRELLDTATQPETLKWFGLTRGEQNGEFSLAETFNDVEAVDALENITRFLVKVIAAAAPSEVLENIWRARWMSLVVSTAFQISPYIQGRAFTVLGVLARSDVDDDLLYQILVAFRKALQLADEVEAPYIVSMLRCLTNIVPSLSGSSRYLSQMFWLPVTLLHSPNAVIFKESLRLLEAIVQTMQAHQWFDEAGGVVDYLLEIREPFGEIMNTFESAQGLSFELSFTFSLTALIYRGVRVASMRDAAMSTLRTLLRATAQSSQHSLAARGTLDLDAIGYFIALFPWATQARDPVSELYRDADLSPEQWMPAERQQQGIRDRNLEMVRLPAEVLGSLEHPAPALLIVSLIAMMEQTGPPSPPERANMIRFVGEVGKSWPEYAMMACAHRLETFPESVHDLFSETVDPTLVQVASSLIKLTIDEAATIGGGPASASMATLEAISESRTTLRSSLEELGMQGILDSRPFTRESGLRSMEIVSDMIGVIVETA